MIAVSDPDCKLVADFLQKYPNMHFSASKISRETGLSSRYIARVLMKLRERNIVSTITVNHHVIKLLYRWSG